jgi:hypothetical protein
MPNYKIKIKIIIEYTIAESAKVHYGLCLPSSAPETPNMKGQIYLCSPNEGHFFFGVAAVGCCGCQPNCHQ